MDDVICTVNLIDKLIYNLRCVKLPSEKVVAYA